MARPCRNGGTCLRDALSPAQYACSCPAPFSGPNCEAMVLDPRALPEPECPYDECELRAGDGVCDPQCNRHECAWDGGDCSLRRQQPWENCDVASVRCWELFHNGHCDPECDNAGCLFDSFECQNAGSSCKYVRPGALFYPFKV